MSYLFAMILALVSFSSLAQIRTGVDEVKGLKWDGESYHVTLGNYPRDIIISGQNAVVPCLENASKSEMKVLLIIDSDIPMIKSCKLYTPGLIKSGMQAQEELPK